MKSNIIASVSFWQRPSLLSLQLLSTFYTFHPSSSFYSSPAIDAIDVSGVRRFLFEINLYCGWDLFMPSLPKLYFQLVLRTPLYTRVHCTLYTTQLHTSKISLPNNTLTTLGQKDPFPCQCQCRTLSNRTLFCMVVKWINSCQMNLAKLNNVPSSSPSSSSSSSSSLSSSSSSSPSSWNQ